MSWVKDTFLGGAEKKAAQDQIKAIERGQVITTAATDKATNLLTDRYDQAQRDSNLGYQGALDIFGQSVPAQMDVFGQGNVAAQQTIANSMPQIQNALMGGKVDYSQFQPFEVNQPDLSFLQAQLPNYGQSSQQANTNPMFPPGYDNNSPAQYAQQAPLSGLQQQPQWQQQFNQSSNPFGNLLAGVRF